MDLTRRRFLQAAVAGGTAATVPLHLLVRAARVAEAANARFFSPQQYATCAAICARIVPSDQDPGAAEARAVDFIDFFLAAFELPPGVADAPAIYLHGRYSGRNPYPDPSTGGAATTRPPSDFVDVTTGRRHFLPLNRFQELSWRMQLYGPRVITDDPSLPKAFRDAVASGLIPTPPPLRDTYRKGLNAFDAYSRGLFGVTFDQATSAEQDLMLAAAANPVLGNVPVPVVAPPADASTLFPIVATHTFMGCFGLPEYGGNGFDPAHPITERPPMWRWIGWEGDTQPLGNSVYDENLTDAEILAGITPAGGYQGTNAGFGDPAVYQPRGGYREHRPVSTNAGAAPDLAAAQIAGVLAAIRSGRWFPSVRRR